MYKSILEHTQHIAPVGSTFTGLLKLGDKFSDSGGPCLVTFPNHTSTDNRPKLLGLRRLLSSEVAQREVEEYIKENWEHARISILFPASTPLNTDFMVSTMAPSDKIVVTQTTPIIHDNRISIRLSVGGDDPSRHLLSSKYAYDLNISRILFSLHTNRYVNIVFENLNINNRRMIEKTLIYILENLSKHYPYNLANYVGRQYEWSLFDTVSISFYSLPDAIPIFNRNSANGMYVEVAFLNSKVDGPAFLSTPGSTFIVRYIFAKTGEIHVIDGEKVNLSYKVSVASTMDSIGRVIGRSLPNEHYAYL